MNKILIISVIFWTLLMSLIIIMIINNFHPVMIMIILIFYTMLINFNLSLWKSNYMYSIFIFLMMISGLLIIFLYFTSLISNIQNKFSMPKIMTSLIIMNFTFFFLMILNYNLHFSFFLFNNSLELTSLNNINENIFTNIKPIYDYPYNIFTIISLFYLILTLFSIIKICNIKDTSLRKINN